MWIVCLEIVTGIEIYRDAALEEIGRSVWVAMVARLTFDMRVIAVANQHLAEALAVWRHLESLSGSPEARSG